MIEYYDIGCLKNDSSLNFAASVLQKRPVTLRECDGYCRKIPFRDKLSQKGLGGIVHILGCVAELFVQYSVGS